MGEIVVYKKKKYIKYYSIFVAIETNDADSFPKGSDVAVVAQSHPRIKNSNEDFWFTTDVKFKEDK